MPNGYMIVSTWDLSVQQKHNEQYAVHCPVCPEFFVESLAIVGNGNIHGQGHTTMCPLPSPLLFVFLSWCHQRRSILHTVRHRHLLSYLYRV